MPKTIPRGLTREHILGALADLDGGTEHSFGEPVKYELVHDKKRYAPKPVIGLALGRMLKRPVGPRDFSGGERSGQANFVLRELGFSVVLKLGARKDAVEKEAHLRDQMWSDLLAAGGPLGLAPGVLRQVGVYGGAQGIWVDKKRTVELDEDGVTVGVLHTGSSYADDLDDDGVLYHYPKTRRSPARDRAEIDATKAAGELGLPVFVVSSPSPSGTKRDVHRGWVESWDDHLGAFLIVFGDKPPALDFGVENEPAEFKLTSPRSGARRSVSTRAGQQRFKFAVFRRYGPRCAVCDLQASVMLDAAHICPKVSDGSDDPRNGLVLCANHHRAFDAGLFSIEPASLRLAYQEGGPGRDGLAITHDSLERLKRLPHIDALTWAFATWKEKSGERAPNRSAVAGRETVLDD